MKVWTSERGYAMLQQITIQSHADNPLKSVVEIAIRNQLKSLRYGIARTREQLAAFETRFGMTTAEMERRLKSGELAETLATIDWCMELEALRLLEEQYTTLSEARID
jgi:hypothetical protein